MKNQKFRVWNPKNEEWMDGCWIYQSGQLDHDTCESWTLQNCVVQWTTSLLDKKGKEIYEGDIIKYVLGPEDFSWFFDHVFYEGDGFRIGPLDRSSATPLWGTNVCAEIVGNIFENPELLTNQK